MELQDLTGVGKTRLAALHAAGIDSLRDLLYAVPVKYRDLGDVVQAADALDGERQTLRVDRLSEPKIFRHGKMSRVTCNFRDQSGEAQGIWFNQPWMMDALMRRQSFLLYGKAERTGRRVKLLNPTLEDALRIVPIYKPIDGLPQKTHISLVQQALALVEAACAENLPAAVLARFGLPPAPEAILALHAPQRMEAVAAAQRRFAFEQMLLYQLAVGEMRSSRKNGRAIPVPDGAEESFWRAMPFTPTGAQRRTLGEVAADMRKMAAMARMVQGRCGLRKNGHRLWRNENRSISGVPGRADGTHRDFGSAAL